MEKQKDETPVSPVMERVAEILVKREVEASEEKAAAKLDKEQRMEMAQQALKMGQLTSKMEQARCTHLKGGKGTEAIVRGEGDRDHDSCVGSMRLPTGQWILYCSRCKKLTKEGDKDWAKMYKLSRKSSNTPVECMQLRVRPLTQEEIAEQLATLEGAEAN